MKRPLSCVNLNKAIIRLAGAGDSVRLSRTLADVIVGQILPNGGVVKGGSSLLFRYGSAITRYTRDVDAARGLNPETFRMQLEHALATGWNGFTRSNIDLVETHEKCIRLFAYRRRQSWPPVIIPGNNWESTYEAAFETIKDKTALLNSAARAVDWANNLILRIEAAQPDPILSAPASS